MARKQKLKLALLGASGYQRLSAQHRVDCFPWEKIDTIDNLRDYDTVVVDLLSLRSNSSRPTTVSGASIDWEAFRRVLNPMSMRDILGEGSIIVVGDPRFNIRCNEGTKETPAYYTKPFLGWTGIKFYWDNQPGDTVSFNNEWDRHGHFKEYVKHLKQWDYSLRSCELDLESLGKLFNLGKDSVFVARLNTDFFCLNRYGGALAFTASINIERKGHYGYDSDVALQLGPVTFLPKIDLSEDETLVLVLRDICGIEAPLPEPSWIVRYSAPGQKAVDDEIQEIETLIERMLQQHRDAIAKRANTRICLQLLYERGLSLESAVREVLRLLGATVEEPDNPGKEDGWISISTDGNTLEGVMEVKGTKNAQFDEFGIRQLLDWVHRGIELRQKKYKGIFIGNSCVNSPPNERPEPFADNWRKSAELHNFVALRSEDLYTLYLLLSLGKLNVNQFWQDFFRTNGVFKIDSYIPEVPS
jgi:hypothetical protein